MPAALAINHQPLRKEETMKANYKSHQPRFISKSTLISVAALILLACSQSALAQATPNKIPKWTDNSGALGPSTIFEDTSGKVGIGTTTPTQSLDVSGRIVTSGNQTLNTDESSILDIKTIVTNNGATTSGIRMRNTFNGNSDTQQALDVAPFFRPSSNITLARGFVSAAFFAPPQALASQMLTEAMPPSFTGTMAQLVLLPAELFLIFTRLSSLV